MFRFLAALLLAFALLPAFGAELPLDRIRLPPGFDISLHARVPGARSLALGDKGTLFVGTRGDKVYAVSDGRLYTLASGLRSPNGVAFKDGALFVAEISRVLRFDDIEARLANPPAPRVVYDRFPSDGHHGSKFIRFGPDGLLYVPVGAPCNICAPDPARYAAIFRIRPDGSGFEQYARGVRNTVGFDWHPQTKELWFTDNGRDWMGNNAPPDELNHAPRAGMHFGYPYCHGKAIRDPEFGSKRACSEFTPPPSNSARTRPRWACASTPAASSPPPTATRSSSPSTARGTASRRWATASPWSGCATAVPPATKPSQKAGCRASAPGGGPSTCN